MTACLTAAEVTVEERPFLIEAVFNASVMPVNEVTLLRIDADGWQDFRFTELAEHGAPIAKNGLLASFDTEEIDRKLDDTRRAIAAGTLAVAAAEQQLATLTKTAPHRLDATKRAAEIASEEHAYFTETRRKAEEETATQRLKRSKQILENQQEELRQLTKMYQADDITEETEEIILTRQKDDVAAAEFALRMATLDQKRTLEIGLPREAVTLANNERDTTIAHKNAEVEIPRSIEEKKLELESLKIKLQRDKETLADLEHDRPLFEIKAPAAGRLYHGPIENGRWTTGELLKSLVENGRPPVGRPFATFIPDQSKLGFVAFPDGPTALTLKPGLTGTATFAGREDLEIPVELTDLAASPDPDGSYPARLTATWPEGFAPAVGSRAEVRLITYQQPAAILVPSKALARDARGWTVEIMLADGKTERRPVKRGRVSNDETEILTGLEIGQVVIAPDK
jgi:HlyD family secretion protein